jgi:RNA polymerase sigma factor
MFFSRILGRRSSHSPINKEKLEKRVQLAQSGDKNVRNRLIEQYSPFISQVASKVCKRFIDPTRDEEFSVALEAFDEALTKYISGKGSSFLSFADLVIRRRLIDFIRKESRHRGQLSLEYPGEIEEESDQTPIETQISMQQYRLDYEASQRREEIMHYQEKLKEFHIDLADLPDISPKHVDARQNAVKIARTLVNDERLRLLFLEKQKLPMKELMKLVEVSRKTVERNRNYIVAIILLLLEDYHYLHEYLHWDERREGIAN